MRRSIAFVLTSLTALALAPACKPSAGGDCKPNQVACVDKSHGLVCRGGKFLEVPCGNDSCRAVNNDLVCNQNHGEVGQPCLRDMEYACSSDGKTGVQCIGSTFQKVTVCRGPLGCSLVDKRIQCDAAVADVGDPCLTEDLVSCSSDKTKLLRCKAKQFEQYRLCRGPRGCTPDNPTPQCDHSLAEADDTCPQPGRVACTVDKTKELVCQGSRFTFSRKCPAGCTPGPGGATPVCK